MSSLVPKNPLKKKTVWKSEIFNIVLTTVWLSINNYVDFFKYFCSLHKTHKTDKLLLADKKRIGTSKLSFHNHHHSQIMLLSNKNYAKKTAQPCTQNPKVVTQRDSIDSFIHLHCVVHATKAGRNSHRVRSFLHGLRQGISKCWRILWSLSLTAPYVNRTYVKTRRNKEVLCQFK